MESRSFAAMESRSRQVASTLLITIAVVAVLQRGALAQFTIANSPMSSAGSVESLPPGTVTSQEILPGPSGMTQLPPGTDPGYLSDIPPQDLSMWASPNAVVDPTMVMPPEPAETWMASNGGQFFHGTIGKSLFSSWDAESAMMRCDRRDNHVGFRRWTLSNFWTRCTLSEVIDAPGERRLEPYYYNGAWKFTGDLYSDYSDFFAADSLLWFGLITGGGAALANTTADEEFRDWFITEVRDDSPDFHWGKELGEVYIIAPAMAITWGLTEFIDYNPFWTGNRVNLRFRQWSRQSLRALFVAGVPVATMQWITGGSRPDEKPDKGSSWDPFDDNNGVSGHAAVGAVPFLVAAYMSDHWLWKSAFFLGSFIAGYSRIYDDAHYLSQVVLGWSYAALAVESTIDTEQAPRQLRMVPLTLSGLYGVGFEYRW